MRTIEQAIKIGDKKQKSIKTSEIVNAIKAVLTAQNFALTLREIDNELKKRYSKQYESFFVTTDKNIIDKNGAIDKYKLLKIRINDLVTNTAKNSKKIGAVQIKRSAILNANNEVINFDYYAVKTRALVELTTIEVTTAKK